MISHSWTGTARLAACAVLAASDGGGMAAAAATCSAPLQPIELMFGRNIRDRPGAGNAAWVRFLAREITPRFPDGLTIIDAAGQWRDPASGRITREPSRLVIIVTADDATAGGRVEAIVTAYKKRFHQKSVGVVASTVCAAF